MLKKTLLTLIACLFIFKYETSLANADTNQINHCLRLASNPTVSQSLEKSSKNGCAPILRNKGIAYFFTAENEKPSNPYLQSRNYHETTRKLFSNPLYLKAFKLLSASNPENDKTGVSQYLLGVLYLDGRGIQQNQRQAFFWFSQACKKDNAYLPNVFNRMGFYYQQINDFYHAAYFYKKAAESGNALSQYGLAYMYYSGEGVIKNLPQAYAWASTAAAIGITSSESLSYQQAQLSVEKFRDGLASQLIREDPSGNELIQAKALAQQYYNLYVIKKK